MSQGCLIRRGLVHRLGRRSDLAGRQYSAQIPPAKWTARGDRKNETTKGDTLRVHARSHGKAPDFTAGTPPLLQ